MNQIVKVKPLDHYKLWIRFADGIEGEVDLSHLAGKGVFKKWDDYNFFKNVKTGRTGDLYWDDQIDLCPDSLYMKITNKTPDELFPALTKGTVDA